MPPVMMAGGARPLTFSAGRDEHLPNYLGISPMPGGRKEESYKIKQAFLQDKSVVNAIASCLSQ